MAKFWDNLTATPALFAGLLLYSSEQGGGYAILRGIGTGDCTYTNPPTG
ncbi:hypothetical protein NIES2100_23510 [Calothrix sp. NIES-2100]|nr:hypothetical protein NIES2100_23510 [Calothrix sp. NIES-2100]